MSFRQVNEVNAAGIPLLRRILARFAARMTLGLHISKLLRSLNDVNLKSLINKELYSLAITAITAI